MSTLVFKYARAFLNTHCGDMTRAKLDQLTQVAQELEKLNEAFMYVTYAQKGSPEAYKSILHFLKKFDADTLLEGMVKFLAQQGRLNLLADILNGIVTLYKEDQAIVVCMVKSSCALTEDQKVLIENSIKDSLAGKQAEITYNLDPDLIAGIRIQIDDCVGEYSVAKQIGEMRNALAEVYGGN